MGFNTYPANPWPMSTDQKGSGGSGGEAFNPDMIAPEFSDKAQYMTGDLVFYDGSLYRFDVDHDPGAWNSEEVMATTIAENLVMFPGDGLRRNLHEYMVKIQVGGGLGFDENGALYTNVIHNYSANEQPTGQNWIDGSPIYFKTINFGALPDNTYKSVNTGLTDVKIIKIEGIAISSDYSIPLPEPSANNQNAQIYYEYASNSITIATGGSFSGYTESYITLYYIKTA